MTNTETELRQKLTDVFSPIHLDVIDESHLHAGHREAQPGKSTHFQVTIVSEKFEGLLPIKQHRLVYSAIDDLMKSEIHALALNTIRPSKWQS